MSIDAVTVVEAYITGFVSNDAPQILSTIAPNLVMIGTSANNTNHIDAHMFLNGEAVEQWVGGMLSDAGPHENQFQLHYTSERMGATVIMMRETGKNRFRTWDNQLVTYILGDFGGQWKIMAYHLI